MRWVAGLAVLCLSGCLCAGEGWAQTTQVMQTMQAAGIPPEIIDLCRTMRDRIVNQGADVGVPTDLLGQPRPSGGGVDIGAIECDGAGASGGPPVPGPPVPPVPRIVLKALRR